MWSVHVVLDGDSVAIGGYSTGTEACALVDNLGNCLRA